MRMICSSETSLALQKSIRRYIPVEIFISTAVRTSNRVQVILFEIHKRIIQRKPTAGYTYKHAHTSIYTYNIFTGLHSTYKYAHNLNTYRSIHIQVRKYICTYIQNNKNKKFLEELIAYKAVAFCTRMRMSSWRPRILQDKFWNTYVIRSGFWGKMIRIFSNFAHKVRLY
jgi:hypothetical protein